MKNFIITSWTNFHENERWEVEAESLEEAQKIALEEFNITVEEVPEKEIV
jgi:hypothetical protein